jgi:hypothetical protein
VSGKRHVIMLHRAIDAAGRPCTVVEAQDEITRVDGKPVEMVDAITFVVPETGEQLIRERSF